MNEIWCESCGDQVTPHNPGICGTCYAIKYRDQPTSEPAVDAGARADALGDSAYCAGLQQGFTFGQLDDNEGLRKALEARQGYLAVLRESRAALSARASEAAAGDPVAFISPQELNVLRHNARAAVSPQGMRYDDETIALYTAPPSASGQKLTTGCIAPNCHQWDGTDTCTCKQQKVLDVLNGVAKALPVLRSMLHTEGLAGVDVADGLLAEIQSLLRASSATASDKGSS